MLTRIFWIPHINHVCLNISKSIGIIYRSRFYLSSKSKFALYYSIVYPYLSYCNTTPLFLQLKILDIFKLNEFHVAKFMFADHHQILPPLFCNLFLFNKQVHNYYTGSSDDYRSHNYRTNTNKFTVLFQGPSLWNSLPAYIKKGKDF